MFNKLKMKASQPLTHGWLWKIGAFDIAAVGLFYGSLWIYGRYLEKELSKGDAASMNGKSEDED